VGTLEEEGREVNPLRLPTATGRPVRILCLGAHSDDIEIGCGGTLLHLLATRRAAVDWVVFSAAGRREAEAKRGASRFLRDAVERRVVLHAYRDGFFPAEWARIKESFRTLQAEVAPDLIFTHFRDDRHQDHRVLSDLTWNTFRDHQILEYEIPKWDGDLGRPNVYVPLTAGHARRKVAGLMAVFASQRSKRWFSEETFRALLRLRGIEAGVEWAEAFHGRKTLIT
jgi:LmbE family N-acetylglucosaminyl deacetylase